MGQPLLPEEGWRISAGVVGGTAEHAERIKIVIKTNT
jgi:hypothetical protein